MNTKTHQLSVTSTLIYGAPWAGPYTQTYRYALTLYDSEEKASIDTGSFVPGIYRCNPYYRKRATYKPTFETTLLKVVVGSWFYTTTDEGHLGAMLLQTAASRILASNPLSAVSQLQNQVLNRAYAKTAEALAGIGEDLGEIRETFNMMRNPADSLKKFLNGDVGRKLNRLQRPSFWSGPNGVAAGTRALTDLWLEFKLGLLPFVKTIEALLKLADERAKRAGVNRIMRKRSTLSTESTSSIEDVYAYYGIQYLLNIEMVHKIRVNASVMYRLNRPVSLMDDLGLSAPHLPETIWALTSRSFLVDWFLDVSSYIAAHSSSLSVEVLGHSIGTRSSRSLRASGSTKWTKSGVTSTGMIPDLGEYEVEEYARTCGESPSLFPAITQDALSISRQITGLAILLSGFANKFQQIRDSKLRDEMRKYAAMHPRNIPGTSIKPPRRRRR